MCDLLKFRDMGAFERSSSCEIKLKRLNEFLFLKISILLSRYKGISLAYLSLQILNRLGKLASWHGLNEQLGVNILCLLTNFCFLSSLLFFSFSIPFLHFLYAFLRHFYLSSKPFILSMYILALIRVSRRLECFWRPYCLSGREGRHLYRRFISWNFHRLLKRRLRFYGWKKLLSIMAFIIMKTCWRVSVSVLWTLSTVMLKWLNSLIRPFFDET